MKLFYIQWQFEGRFLTSDHIWAESQAAAEAYAKSQIPKGKRRMGQVPAGSTTIVSQVYAPMTADGDTYRVEQGEQL